MRGRRLKARGDASAWTVDVRRPVHRPHAGRWWLCLSRHHKTRVVAFVLNGLALLQSGDFLLAHAVLCSSVRACLLRHADVRGSCRCRHCSVVLVWLYVRSLLRDLQCLNTPDYAHSSTRRMAHADLRTSWPHTYTVLCAGPSWSSSRTTSCPPPPERSGCQPACGQRTGRRSSALDHSVQALYLTCFPYDAVIKPTIHTYVDQTRLGTACR